VKSAVETLTPTRVKLNVEVPFDELKPSLDSAYRTIAEQIQVPGFRRGKVPARIIDQRVGRDAVIDEAINEALPRFYGQALAEIKAHPLGQPEVDVTSRPDPATGQDFAFTAELDVRPTIELPDFATIEVSVADADVTEADVDAEVLALRQRFGTLVVVERAAVEGDFVSLDLSASLDGAEIDSVTGVSYEVGTKNMLEGLDEVLVGMAAGETQDFQAPLAGGDHEGADAQCTVTVQSVKERELPELDDEFAELYSEFDTVAEFLADVRTKAEQEAKFKQGTQARDAVLDALLAATEIPLPENVVQAEVSSHLSGEDRLEDDEHRVEVEVDVRKGLQTQFLLDAVVDKSKVSVNQGELIEYLVMSSQQYGMEPQAFVKAVEEAGQIQAMVAEVARRKGLAVALEQAVVTDASGNRVDLEALRPSDDGAVEPPAEADDAKADATDA
jgi:trigger factor